MKVQLVVIQGKPEGKVIPLNGPTFRIGRGETCQLRPNNEMVSREHAEFKITADQVVIRDLGSRNGTLVNNQMLTEPMVLKDRDLVQVGPLTFAVSIQGAPAVSDQSARPTPSRSVSPDDVSHDEIESWLVSGENAPSSPERPSGIYGGDTISVNVRKDSGTAAESASAHAAFHGSPKPASPQDSQQKPPAASRPPTPESAQPATPSASKPATPAGSQLRTPGSAHPSPPTTSRPLAPSAPKPSSLAASKPSPTVPSRPPTPDPSDPSASDFGEMFEDMEFERLPEGEGDREAAVFDNDDISDQPTEEFTDESNPFYNNPKTPPAPDKPKLDTSDAASDILKRMMERKRSR